MPAFMIADVEGALVMVDELREAVQRCLILTCKLALCAVPSLSCGGGNHDAMGEGSAQQSSGQASSGAGTSGGASSGGGTSDGTVTSDGTTSSGGASTTGGAGTTDVAGAMGTTAGIGGTTGGSATTASSSQGGSGGVASGGAGAGGASSATGGAGGSGGGTMQSSGCGAPPTLTNSPSSMQLNYNMLTSGGESRQYVLRWPESYDDNHPYRLILGFHGATGDAGEVARNSVFFGLHELSEESTIFIATEAVGGLWSAERDLIYVDDILAEVLADLCIDTTRIELEGFSQGGAMVQTLACARPNVFRAAVAHSAGGLTRPETCEPIPYLGSLGLQENGGQSTQTDFFATANGCTVATLPSAPSGGHLCSDYSDCSMGYPVRWCPYDGGHTPSPTDSGQSSSWMPEEVWAFLSQF